ncbi:MAG TPA: trigger factor [Arcobacter sp.]|nr:trigger factor [Arcobacter sp.]
MTFKTNKIDEANANITGTISAETVDKNIDKVAKQAAKTMDIQGFRKGKVPVAIVKARYADKMTQDAEGEALRSILDDALVELKIANTDLIGEPAVTKFEKDDNNNITFEISVSCKPQFDLGDYKSLVPKMKAPKVDDKEIKEQLNDMAAQGAPLTKIKRKRAVKSGDHAIIDFEGFKDGVAFDGGKADGHVLEIGSNSFIPGFEDQVIGMKYDEEKEIKVTFPEEYQSKDLAGADVVFKVTLHEIQERVAAELDDELAKKMLPQEKDATIDTLKEKLEDQLLSQKKNQYFTEEIKPSYIEALVKSINFAVPASVLEQEINQALNVKVKAMSEEEIKALQENPDEVKKMRDEIKPEALNSVKATFIIDALAKEEKIEVTDQEVTQTIYYEAMMGGQDGQAVIKQYEEAGYLPMIKMSMIESKVMIKILDEALGK